MRLYLVCTSAGVSILWALTKPNLDEREILPAMLDRDPGAVTERPGLLLIVDKCFASKELKPVRQLIESVNGTLKGQLDLEQHGSRPFGGVAVRVAQRVLALAAAIWHNHKPEHID